MTIASYSDLVTAIDNWTHRSDVSSRTPEFIALFEAKINRLLQTRDMVQKDAAFSITGQFVACPTGMAMVKEFYLNTSPPVALEYMTGVQQTQLYQSNTGRPKAYAIEGNNFKFGPTPDATYSATIVYTKGVTGLSGSNTTNWLITAHPDVYLYGVLAEAAIWMPDDARVPGIVAMSEKVIEQLRSYDAQSKWGGPAMAVRVG